MIDARIDAFFKAYRGLAGAAAEFALQDGHAPNAFVVLILESGSPFAGVAIERALTYTRRRGGIGVTLTTAHAQALLTEPPPGYAFAASSPDTQAVVDAIGKPQTSDSSWLVVLAGEQIAAWGVTHRLHGINRVNAAGGAA
jgi:hypothetical protein